MTSPSTRQPTGRAVRNDDGTLAIVYERRFGAPIEDVWASVTEPERLARWIGTWTGRPAVGRSVTFRMLFEGDVPSEDALIRACQPPRLLEVAFDQEGSVTSVRLELAETDGVTTLTMTTPVPSQYAAGDFGPGWEYYLDRLVAARDGTEMPDFAEYHPGQSAHFQESVRAGGG